MKDDKIVKSIAGLLVAGLIALASIGTPGHVLSAVIDALRREIEAGPRGRSRSHSNGVPITQFERGARA